MVKIGPGKGHVFFADCAKAHGVDIVDSDDTTKSVYVERAAIGDLLAFLAQHYPGEYAAATPPKIAAVDDGAGVQTVSVAVKLDGVHELTRASNEATLALDRLAAAMARVQKGAQ